MWRARARYNNNNNNFNGGILIPKDYKKKGNYVCMLRFEYRYYSLCCHTDVFYRISKKYEKTKSEVRN